jgi:hypothetical protein
VSSIQAGDVVELGLSNDAIADKAGYNEKTIRDLIKGRCLVHKTVKDVCSALGINLEQVLIRSGLDVSAEGNVPHTSADTQKKTISI